MGAKLRRHLLVGWIVSLTLVVGIAVTAIFALRITAAGEGVLARDLSEDLISVQRLRLEAERVIGTTRAYLLTGESTYEARLETLHHDFEAQLLVLIDDSKDPEGSSDAAAVERAARAYTLAAQTVAEARSASGDPRAIVASFEATLQPKRADLESSVTTFVKHRRAMFDESIARVQRRAGTAQLVLIAAALIAIALGVVLAVAVIRTVTAQFRRVEVAQTAAESASAARQELLAIVSHDLRNPLGAIILGTSALEESCAGIAHRQVQIVHNAATRMQHMIDQLLEAARLDAGNVVLQAEPCDARRLVEDTVELFQARAHAQHVELRTMAHEARLVGDRERLLEVLSNLIANALKFTPPGGRIVVCGERRDRDVHFAVADTGPGIAREQLPHLFERYWQGERHRHNGLGLGLYICKRLVDAHRGTIGVDSTLGTGTTFWFDVPAAAG